MSKFVYRMQNILNIKEKLEEQAKMDYGMARARLTEEEEKLERLFGRRAGYEDVAREALREELHPRQMRENKEAILRMDEFIDLQRLEIQKAEEKLEEERVKLQDAMQERKIQEKLRENAFEVFMEEEKARESREIDELTSYTYGQKKAGEAPAESENKQ